MEPQQELIPCKGTLMTYEVEIKIELTEAERLKLLQTFSELHFVDKGTTLQHDYYTKAALSQHGEPRAFDIERYRSEGEKFMFAKKDWEVVDGKPIRREEEHPVTREEFDSAVENNPDALKIVKDRQSFVASFEDTDINLSIDSVKFDHSPLIRHFMEPEILVEDKAKVAETKELLRRFVAFLLGTEVASITEAPGMFAMAFKKL